MKNCAIRCSFSARAGRRMPRTMFEPLDRRKADVTASMFDGPDPKAIVPVRAETTTPQQALFLLNSPLVIDTSRRLAERLAKDSSLTDGSTTCGAIVDADTGPAARRRKKSVLPSSFVARSFLGEVHPSAVGHQRVCLSGLTCVVQTTRRPMTTRSTPLHVIRCAPDAMIDRRHMLGCLAGGFGTVGLASLLGEASAAEATAARFAPAAS